jgi:nucleoid DNA-binding protein
LIYYEKSGITREAATARIWKSLLTLIESSLIDGKAVAFRGMFSVVPYMRKESTYRDMRTGMKKKSPARRTLRLAVPYPFKQRIR